MQRTIQITSALLALCVGCAAEVLPADREADLEAFQGACTNNMLTFTGQGIAKTGAWSCTDYDRDWRIVGSPNCLPDYCDVTMRHCTKGDWVIRVDKCGRIVNRSTGQAEYGCSGYEKPASRMCDDSGRPVSGSADPGSSGSGSDGSRNNGSDSDSGSSGDGWDSFWGDDGSGSSGSMPSGSDGSGSDGSGSDGSGSDGSGSDGSSGSCDCTADPDCWECFGDV